MLISQITPALGSPVYISANDHGTCVLGVGESAVLQYTLYDEDWNVVNDPGGIVSWGIDYQWTYSGNGDAFYLDTQTGTITALDYGQGSVYAVLNNGQQGYFYVCVTSQNPDSISFAQDRIVLNLRSGNMPFPYASVQPAEASYCHLVWEIADTSIAEINSDQQIIPKQTGTTTLTATAQNGVSGSVSLIVVDGDYAEGISQKDDISTYVLEAGESKQLEYVLYPQGGTFADENVSWRVENASPLGVISLDASGLVTAYEDGNASVIATTVTGNETRWTIHVQPRLTAIAFDNTKDYFISNELGEIYISYYYNITPSTSYQRELRFESSDTNVLDFEYGDNNPCAFIKGVGTTTITVTSVDDPTISASHVFAVYQSVDATSISPIGETSFQLYKNCMYHNDFLGVKYEPANAGQETTWSVNDDSIVSMAMRTDAVPGFFTTRAPGTTTVTATNQRNSALSQDFSVTVLDEEPPIGTYKTTVLIGPKSSNYSYPTIDPDQCMTNPEEYTVTLNEECVLDLEYTSNCCIPSNTPDLRNDLTYFNAQPVSGRGGADGEKVLIERAYLLTATQIGTQTIQFGNDYSITLHVIGRQTKITKQPEDVNIALGGSATFSITADGDMLKYQWYYSLNGGITFKKWKGREDSAFMFVPKEERDGMKVYCLVTDGAGNELKSDTVTLTFLPNPITKQPVELSQATITFGRSATFAIETDGGNYTYQWYYRLADKTKFQNWTGRTSSSFTYVPKDEKYDGMEVRCIVTDAEGNTWTSESAYLTFLPNPITKQPAEISNSAIVFGSSATFAIETDDGDYTYQWYYKLAGKTKFQNWTGRTSVNFTYVPKDEKYDGMEVHCIVTDVNGNSWTSDSTYLMFLPSPITKDPEDVTVTLGKSATFSVETDTGNYTYQWFYKLEGKTKFQEWKGRTGSSVTFVPKDGRDGMEVRCTVSDADNHTWTSSVATLHLTQ